MLRIFAKGLIVMAVYLMLPLTGYCGSWVQSQNQGLFIRHPEGWKVFWSENGVSVGESRNEMTWCEVRTHRGSGTSQQFTRFILDDVKSKVQDLKVICEKQIDQRPDVFGVKFAYQFNGTPGGSVLLTASADGKEFITRQYAAPARAYDQAKLTLIPILLSFGQRGGGAGGVREGSTGNMQALRSPRGFWSFRAPAGWRLSASSPEIENSTGYLEGPRGELVAVEMARGDAVHQMVTKARVLGRYPTPQEMNIPFLQASALLQYVLFPHWQMSRPQVEIIDLKPVSAEQARYSISYVSRSQGVKRIEEGIVSNTSAPHAFGDYNLYTLSYVSGPAETFSTSRDQLWKILFTFEPSPMFGQALKQLIMQMRRESQQAATNMILQTIQTNRRMMQQTLDTTLRMAEQRRQEGDAWIRVFSGTEIARDPATGHRYEVPVGGRYIYGSDVSGRVIRSDRSLSPNELPPGFQQLESVGLY